MLDLLSKMKPGEFIGLVAVVGGLVVGAISILVNYWRRVRLAELEAALKQQMLDRGMAAAEIEQVLKASRRSRGAADAPDGTQFTGNASADKVALIKLMTEYGYTGEAIERVLQAFGQHADRGEAAVRDKAVAVANMVANEMEADDIERVLLAFDGSPQQAPSA